MKKIIILIAFVVFCSSVFAFDFKTTNSRKVIIEYYADRIENANLTNIDRMKSISGLVNELNNALADTLEADNYCLIDQGGIVSRAQFESISTSMFLMTLIHDCFLSDNYVSDDELSIGMACVIKYIDAVNGEYSLEVVQDFNSLLWDNIQKLKSF